MFDLLRVSRVLCLLVVLGGYVAAYKDAEPAAFARGIAAMTAQEFDKAEAAFSECIAAGASKQAALVNRGVARLRAGRGKDAIADFGEAIRLDPEDAVAYFNRAVARASLGLEKSVLTDLTRANELAEAGKGGPEAEPLKTSVAPVLARLKPIMDRAQANRDKAVQAEADLRRLTELQRSGAVSTDEVDMARVRLFHFLWVEAFWRYDLDTERKYKTEEVKVRRSLYQRTAEVVRNGAGFPEEADLAEVYLREAEIELYRCDSRGDDIVKSLEAIVALRRRIYERAVASLARGSIARDEVDAAKRRMEDTAARVPVARNALPLPKRTTGLADAVGQPILRRPTP
jgi:tetratricopeptide (TPR) repeat protein